MLKRTEIRLVVLGLALFGTASAWYLISPLFTGAMVHAVFPTLGFMPSRTPRPATETPLPTETSTVTPDLGQSLLDVSSAQLMSSGQFYEVTTSGHGTASVYQSESGQLILHLQDFQVDEGSDLHVELVFEDQIKNEQNIDFKNPLDLGILKSLSGNQNYGLPTGIELGKYHSVVIWSVSANQAFIAAALETP